MLKDMGNCYFDTDAKPVWKQAEDGGWYGFYCPYIPKWFVDGPEIGSNDVKRNEDSTRSKLG